MPTGSLVNILDLSLLSAMLAPAFFLTACGSMLLNANNRLARISDVRRFPALPVRAHLMASCHSAGGSCG